MTSRVVGSPRSSRLFGAKSIEALNASERRRSGVHVSPPQSPLHPPRILTEVDWAEHLASPSDDARRQCGLPVLSAASERAQPLSPAAQSVSSDSQVTATGEMPSPPRKSLWRRILEAFCCLRGR